MVAVVIGAAVGTPGGEYLKVWLFKHALRVVGAVALVAGGYMVISGVLSLS